MLAICQANSKHHPPIFNVTAVFTEVGKSIKIRLVGRQLLGHYCADCLSKREFSIRLAEAGFVRPKPCPDQGIENSSKGAR